MVKGGERHFFHKTDPCRTDTVPVPWLRDARPSGRVTYCSICASTMPRPIQGMKVQFYCEDDLLLLSSYYLPMLPCTSLWFVYLCVLYSVYCLHEVFKNLDSGVVYLSARSSVSHSSMICLLVYTVCTDPLWGTPSRMVEQSSTNSKSEIKTKRRTI